MYNHFFFALHLQIQHKHIHLEVLISLPYSAPSSPVLNVLSINTSNEITTRNVTFGWPLENNTDYVLSVTPTPQHCNEPCVYRTDGASLSIPLLTGVHYSITGRAVRCNGTLSSNESLFGFIVPGYSINHSAKTLCWG